MMNRLHGTGGHAVRRQTSSWALRLKWTSAIGIVSAVCALCGGLLTAQPDAKRITFYTPRTSYSLMVVDRNGTEYVGLMEALGSMGPVTAQIDGTRWKLKFRDIEAQFEVAKTKAKIHGKSVQLAAPFEIENSRGLLPVASIPSVLPLFGISPIDFHAGSRRVFAGAAVVHFSGKRTEPGKVVFSFTAPVSPSISTETGKLRMRFDREPIQADAAPISLDDKLVQSAVFSESNGGAELTVEGNAVLSAALGDDHKTVTVTAVPPPPAMGASGASMTTPDHGAQANAQSTTHPKPHPFVIIDAAHGGSDKGALLTSRLAEKDFTLALALRLRHDLEERGVTCAMVREGDVTISSDQRAAIANASKASFYIAIHASGVGPGVRLYSSMLSPVKQGPLTFVAVRMAQGSQLTRSRSAASFVAGILAKRDIPAISLPASVTPLNSIGIPAVAIEVGPPADGADEFPSAAFQQSISASLAAAISAVQPQLTREVAQ
jgi:N-acetylmuramoyl-L-alanine amidase